MEGTVASSSEVGARWAHSESQAVRWRDKYAQLLSNRVRINVPFDILTATEKSLLNEALIAQRQDMARATLTHSEYICQSWSKDELGRCLTLPRMAPNRNAHIPFLSFVACHRFLEESDPRVQADRIPFDQPFNQTEPVIVIPYNGGNLLLEGYLRSVLFIRNANPDLKILVWYPVPKGD